jgi:hypothetical protein
MANYSIKIFSAGDTTIGCSEFRVSEKAHERQGHGKEMGEKEKRSRVLFI